LFHSLCRIFKCFVRDVLGMVHVVIRHSTPTVVTHTHLLLDFWQAMKPAPLIY
jgi:hypothetical protein